MTTTPPTDGDIDTFVAARDSGLGVLNFYLLFGATENLAQEMFSLTSDNVAWVLAYTDNNGDPHYEGLGTSATGVVGASDAEIEAVSPPVFSGGGPYTASGSSPISLSFFYPLPYLQWLIETYGAVNIRGYLIPAIPGPWLPDAVNSTVQAWVNDTGNWPPAG